MAGGSLTITVDDEGMLPAVIQRVLCDILVADRGKVKTTHGGNGRLAIVVPEEIFQGALALKPGGTNILAGYVAGTKVIVNVGNAGSSWLGPTIADPPGACPGDANRIAINAVATNVGANPKAITIDYANGVGLGTVDVDWGDGTTTLGAAESNAALAHTYKDVGAYVITIRDSSAPVDATAARTAIKIP